MKVIIYGLGSNGKEFLDKTRELFSNNNNHMELIAVSDSDSTKGQYYGELYINSKEIVNCKYDYIVVTSEKYFEEIRYFLSENMEIEIGKIVSKKEFIEKVDLYKCNICENSVIMWEQTGMDLNHVLHKNIIGAGIRKGICPKCKSLDRTRFVDYILQQYTDIYKEECSVLHFAPEIQLKEKLTRNQKCSYLSADIEQGRADVTADITDLQFQDQTYDYIICNHVLEHIQDLQKAFSELKRVIKQKGKIIVTVPICWEIETQEDETITSKEERLKHFGQEDHVRLFGNDIVKIFEKNDFKVNVYKCDEILDGGIIHRYGLISKDCVFVLNR